MFRLSPLLLWFTAFIASSNIVEARYKASYKTKGLGASASAYVYEDECSYEYLSIDGSSSALKEKTSHGKPSTSYNTYTYASYSSYNYCTGEEAYGYAEVYPGSFTGDKNGAAATATISSLYICRYVEVEEGCYGEYNCEESAEPFELTIDATWTPSGNTSKDRSTSSSSNKFSSYKFRYSGTSREATVTLAVTKNGESLAIDPSSISSYFYTSTTGDMYVDRYEY